MARYAPGQGHKGTLKVYVGTVQAAKEAAPAPAAPPPPPQQTAMPKWAWLTLACSVAFAAVVVIAVLVLHAGRESRDPAPAAQPAAVTPGDSVPSERWAQHDEQVKALLRQSEARIQRWTELRREMQTKPVAVRNELSMAVFRCDVTLTNVQAQLQSLQQATAEAIREVNPTGRELTRQADSRILALSSTRERLEAAGQRADEQLDAFARQLSGAATPAGGTAQPGRPATPAAPAPPAAPAAALLGIPFEETFEGLAPGALHGQRGWVARGVVVQDKPPADGGGSAAYFQRYGLMRRAFDDGRTKVWVDMRLQLASAETDAVPTPEADTTAAFYVAADRQLIAFDGPTAVRTGRVISRGEWVRITVYKDYTAAIWVLHVDGARVGQYRFVNPSAPSYRELQLSGGMSSHVDYVRITLDPPSAELRPE